MTRGLTLEQKVLLDNLSDAVADCVDAGISAAVIQNLVEGQCSPVEAVP